MQDLEGRVAVITGAASGIGLAMARRFGRAGMRVVLADIEKDPLEAAGKALQAAGIDTLSVETDVGDAEQMDRLGGRVRADLGPVDLLCLNAGVSGGGGPLETLTTADWEWGLRVNLWGVIHGLRVFLPDMRARDDGHIVLTSSIAGLICSPQAAPYHATKHAIAAIAETLFRELSDAESKLGISCLCPGLVDTRFPTGDRNRPADLQNPGAGAIPREQIEALHRAALEVFKRGVSSAHVADCVFEAVRQRRFWVYTDEVHRDVIKARHRAIENGEDPPTQGGALDGY